MNRVNVIGTTGSGKSIFSKELSSILGVPYIQLDELLWKSNWQESPDEEFLPVVEKAVAGDLWVIDGNFSRTTSIKWLRADTVVWLDFSYFITFKQLLLRTLKRVVRKNELWPNTGNKESFRRSFFSRSSILLWFFQNYSRNRKKYFKAMNSDKYSSLEFVRLTSPGEARTFLEKTRNKLIQQGTASDAAA